jgi:hypothetical protein
VLVPLLFAAAAALHTTSVTPRATTPRAVTACRALTRSDVQFALGRTVGKAEEESSAASSTCDYATERARVTVSLQRLDRDPDIATEIAALKHEIEGATSRPAPAFGPQAFFLDIANGGTQLHVIRGRDYLLVSVLGFGEAPQVSPAVEAMARTAMSRW